MYGARDASVQALYGPRGGMAFTRQSSGTCVPAAYKHLFLMVDLYRPFLRPGFDSIADCFPFEGEVKTKDRKKIMWEHYKTFISKMTTIPYRNFHHKRFDDREDLKTKKREHMYLPSLDFALPYLVKLANKQENTIIPENTGVVFMSSADGSKSHAMACVDGTFIDSNDPTNPDRFQTLKNEKWKLQAITVVGVRPDELQTDVVPEAQAAKDRIDRGVVIQEYPHFQAYDDLSPEERRDFLPSILLYIDRYRVETADLPERDELMSKLRSDWNSLREKVKQDYDNEFGDDFHAATSRTKMRQFYQKYPPKE